MPRQPEQTTGLSANEALKTTMPLNCLFWSFLRIGAMGFGGPFALISLMERVFVRQKSWITAEQFAESTGIGSLAPGPISSNAVAVLGYRLRGLPGSIVAFTAFHLPAVVLVLVLAGSFKRIQQLDTVNAALKGVFAAVVGLLFGVGWRMVRSLVTDFRSGLVVLVPFVAVVAFHLNPAIVVLASGFLGYLLLRPR